MNILPRSNRCVFDYDLKKKTGGSRRRTLQPECQASKEEKE